VLSPPHYTEQVLRHFQEEMPLEDLLSCLARDLQTGIGGCLGLLLAYRPTPQHPTLVGSTARPHPETHNLLRALEQKASLCSHAMEVDGETHARLRRILGLTASRAFLYPVRPMPDAPVELFVVALYDESVHEPSDIFTEPRLHQLLFHLRGAALRLTQRPQTETGQGAEDSGEDVSLATLTEVGAALTTALNLEDLSRLILEISAKLVGAHQGHIRLIEGQDETQHFSLQRNSQPKDCGHLYVPIARHGRLKALLTLNRAASTLTDKTIKTLHHFADQAAMAIENAQIFEWEQERAREATALYQAARTIEEAHELEDILRCSTEVFTRLAGLDRCIVLLKDSRKSFFAVASACGLSPDQEQFFSTFRLPIAELSHDNKKRLFQGQPIIFRSAPEKDSGFSKFTTLLPSYASLILPLKSQERLLGLIFLDSSRGAHHYSAATVRQLLTLSLQVANAIQRASLIQKLQENLGPLKALYQVSTAITGTLSLPRVIRLIVDQCVELLDYVSCALLVLDETGESFRIETSGPDDEAFRQPSFQARMAKESVESKRAHAHYIDQEDTDIEVRRELLTQGFGGLLSVPLIAKKKMVGVLNCFVPPKLRFRQQEIRLLKGFANQAAIAVDNARLHGMIRFKMNELGTLFEVSKAVTSTLQLPRVLEEIVYHVRTILNAEACVLMLKEGNHLVLKAIKGLEPGQHQDRIAVGEGPSGIAVQTGQTLVYHDDKQPLPITDPETIIQTGLSVPIKTRGNIIGLINVYYRDYVDHTPAQLSLLSTLCGQAAVAIENARLFADKEQVTELLRGALIPDEEMQFKNLTIGHRFIPSQDLSGDYYDLIPLGPKKCAFVIADVSGKGPEAAIQTVRAKHVIRSYAIAGYGPAKILGMLNHHVHTAVSGMTRAVTVFYAEADLETKTLRYACAGHEQPLYWTNRHKEPMLLDADGIMIGAWEGAEFEEKSMTIEPDSWLLLYTDGLTEARSPAGEFFGLERIVEIAKEHEGNSAQRLVNRLYSRIRKFTRERISDDFSLLAVKF
jgi:GAF domain-containing protein